MNLGRRFPVWFCRGTKRPQDRVDHARSGGAGGIARHGPCRDDPYVSGCWSVQRSGRRIISRGRPDPVLPRQRRYPWLADQTGLSRRFRNRNGDGDRLSGLVHGGAARPSLIEGSENRCRLPFSRSRRGQMLALLTHQRFPAPAERQSRYFGSISTIADTCLALHRSGPGSRQMLRCSMSRRIRHRPGRGLTPPVRRIEPSHKRPGRLIPRFGHRPLCRIAAASPGQDQPVALSRRSSFHANPRGTPPLRTRKAFTRRTGARGALEPGSALHAPRFGQRGPVLISLPRQTGKPGLTRSRLDVHPPGTIRICRCQRPAWRSEELLARTGRHVATNTMQRPWCIRGCGPFRGNCSTLRGANRKNGLLGHHPFRREWRSPFPGRDNPLRLSA